MKETDKEREGGEPLDAVCAGYASVDRICRVSHLPAPGTTAIVLSEGGGLYRGGCAFNIAVGMAAHGLTVGLVGALGDDAPGRAYLRWLARNRVDTSALSVVRGARTPRSHLYYAPDGTGICYYRPGASAHEGDPARQSALLARARWLVLGVAPAGLTARLLDEATRLGLPVAWSAKADPQAYPPSLVHRLVACCRIIFLNRNELDFVAGATGLSGPEAVLAAGPQMQVVVLTLGAEGSRVLMRDGSFHVPPAPVREVVDPTGSGDAYVAGFMSAYIRGATPSEAARIGAACAARVLGAFGSQPYRPGRPHPRLQPSGDGGG